MGHMVGGRDNNETMRLDLGGNYLTDVSLGAIGNLIKTNTLCTLDIQSNNFKFLRSKYFFECLEQNHSILELDISNIYLSDSTY